MVDEKECNPNLLPILENPQLPKKLVTSPFFLARAVTIYRKRKKSTFIYVHSEATEVGGLENDSLYPCSVWS